MNDTGFLNFNGKIYKNDKLLISPNNRSFRYGDGCFETMKMIKGKIILESYHLERLFTSLQTLQFNKPSFFISDLFREQILELAKKNYHIKYARIRITVFRGNGGLYDTENNNPNYLIQTWDLNTANNKFNENGLVMGIYTPAKKSCDSLSSIKNNNFLCYSMAALWAKEQKLNDALLLNSFDKIADSTIANIFIVKDGIIQTPALTQGCISGVTRKYLLKSLRQAGIPVEETIIGTDDLKQASEVFLTNAIYGIRWVQSIDNLHYNHQLSDHLHKNWIAPLFV